MEYVKEDAEVNNEVNPQLQLIHKLELKIAVEIKRICEKNNINYFITGGTLLGAVRHGGFIPWDDDMDMGMLRYDYDRFLKACETDLGDEFFLQTWDTDENYPFSFAKIKLNGTIFLEKFSEGVDMHKGIFVDIFPYDSVPNDAKARKKQKQTYFICKRILWIKKGLGKIMKETPKQALKYYTFLIFSKFFDYESVKADYYKAQIKYNNEITTHIVTDGSYDYDKEALKREWIENLAPINFEGEEFMAVKAVDEYLTHLYGDYMQLPPVEERDRHLLIGVDFGLYSEEDSKNE
ncbi:MAG: phosphorylcholine transferase LicD [Eubacterium sp.]